VNAARKTGIVFGGYAAAFLLAAAAFALRLLITAHSKDAQASGGMSAFGDSVVFVFVFGVAALAPTGLALYFLRPVQRFWTVASMCALAFAVTGVAASALFWTTRSQPPTDSLLSTAAAMSLGRVIVAPLLTAAFLVCAGFAPAAGPRRTFALAALCEGGAAAPWFLWVGYHVLVR
jgi:hypothetical protein